MNRTSLLFIVLALAISCNPVLTTYTFIYNNEGPNRAIAMNMERLLEETFYNVDIQLIEGVNTNANLDSLRLNKMDMGLIENYVPYTPGVNSVFSVYSEVLHVFYRKELNPENFQDLITNHSIYMGPEMSPSYNLCMDLFTFYDIDPGDVNVTFSLVKSDVVIILTNLLSKDELIGFRDYTLFSFDEVDAYMNGSSEVDAIALKYPRLEPFVIPRNTYWNFTGDPIVTLSIEIVMMVSSRMGQVPVTDLTKTMLQNRQIFAPLDPLLYNGLSESFDRSKLNIPLHEGARVYLDRDEPSFIERYAELGGVILSILIAVTSGIISLTKWQAQKKKDKIDEFYEDLLNVKNQIVKLKDISVVMQKIRDIQSAQNKAFEMLISEELVANDSFRIYMELSKETITELRNKLRALRLVQNKG